MRAESALAAVGVVSRALAVAERPTAVSLSAAVATACALVAAVGAWPAVVTAVRAAELAPWAAAAGRTVATAEAAI
jgi:hypothetical protein